MFTNPWFKTLGISEHEVIRLKISWTSRLLYQMGFVLSWTIITALFVERFGIPNLLWLLALEALFLLGGSLIVRTFIHRVALRTYLLILMGLSVACLGAAFLTDPQSIWFFGLLILAKDVFFYQISIGLFRKSESLFSPQEAQRIMPITDSAVTIGVIVGAGLTVWCVNHLSTSDILGVWAFILFLMGIITYFTPRWLHDLPAFLQPSEAEPHRKNPFQALYRDWKKLKFLRYIVLVIFLQAALVTTIEYEFTKDVQSHIVPHHEEVHQKPLPLGASLFQRTKEMVKEVSHEAKVKVQGMYDKLIVHETLAHDLGMFHLLFGLLALAVQIMLTPQILSRLGVVGSLVSYFVILVVSVLALILGYGSVSLLRAIQHGFHSIGDSAYHISFYSWLSHRREAIRLFLEGIVRPIGILLGVGGLLVISPDYRLVSVLAMAVFITALYRPLKRTFTRLSEGNLRHTEPSIAEKFEAIEVLSQKGHHEVHQILIRELEKKDLDLRIRKKIIKALAQIQHPQVISVFNQTLKDEASSDELKIETLQALLGYPYFAQYREKYAFGQHHLMETLQQLFEAHPHPHVRKLVVMNLFTHRPSGEVAPFFLQMMEQDDPYLRAVCLRSCALFDDPDMAHYLHPYLEHEDPMIQGHAVLALWKYGDQNQLRNQLQALLGRPEKEARIAAIYTLGELQDQLSKPKLVALRQDQDEEVRIHVLIALLKLKDLDHLQALLSIIFEGQTSLARKAYHMLDRLPEDVRDHVRELIRSEVSHRVMTIIRAGQIRHFPDLASLSQATLEELKKLYQIGEKYDCLLALKCL